MKNCTWKQIGTSDYLISDSGQVARIMKPIELAGGYHGFRLTIEGQSRAHSAHRLVARAYIGEPADPALVVNHKDGNKKNNHFENLEWVTRGQNTRHYFDNFAPACNVPIDEMTPEQKERLALERLKIKREAIREREERRKLRDERRRLKLEEEREFFRARQSCSILFHPHATWDEINAARVKTGHPPITQAQIDQAHL